MILEQVANFNIYPDGRLRAGPFTQDPLVLSALLTRHGLSLGSGSPAGILSRTMKGLMMSCSGSDVFGYLLGEDGCEAPSSDLERFLEDVVVPGSVFSIEGHHCPDETAMIVSNFSAWISCGEISMTCSRYVEHRDGRRTTINRQAPAPITRMQCQGDGALCLMC